MVMTPDEKIPFKKTDGLPFGFGSKNNFYRLARWLGFSFVFGLLWIVDDYYTSSRLPVLSAIAEWIAPMIGAIGSLASGAAGAISAGKVNRRGSDLVTSENRLNRDFQANQAAISRTWAENYYNEYQSPSSMVRQYEMAGLNPALMYGSAGASVGPSASVPSGSTSGSSMTPTFHVPDWSELADAAMSFAQIKNINADTDNKKKQGENIDASTQSMLADVDVKIHTVDEIKSNIKKNEKELAYLDSQIGKNRFEVVNLVKQGKLADASEYLSRQQAKLVLSQIGVNDATISKVNAEIGKILAETKESNVRSSLTSLQSTLIEYQKTLLQNQADLTMDQISAVKASARKDDATANQIKAQTIGIDYENFLKAYKVAYARATGNPEPPAGLVGDIYNIFASFVVGFSDASGIAPVEVPKRYGEYDN